MIENNLNNTPQFYESMSSINVDRLSDRRYTNSTIIPIIKIIKTKEEFTTDNPTVNIYHNINKICDCYIRVKYKDYTRWTTLITRAINNPSAESGDGFYISNITEQYISITNEALYIFNPDGSQDYPEGLYDIEIFFIDFDIE